MSQICSPIAEVPDGYFARESEFFQVKVVEGDIVMSRLDEIGEIVRHGRWGHEALATEQLERTGREGMEWGQKMWWVRGLLRYMSAASLTSRFAIAAVYERDKSHFALSDHFGIRAG